MTSRLNFSLTQLEYVLAVRKWGHFAKAAEACHVTQPTLSMQVHKLEEDLGVVLFDRSKKPILLTEAGQKIIDQVQKVLFEARRIEDLVKTSQSTRLEGQLALGVIPTLAPYILPPMMATVNQKYPGLELNIFELQTHRIVEALDNDEIDVGLLAIPLDVGKKIHERHLYYEPFSVLCQKTHELARLKRVKYSLLQGDDIWLLQEGHCLRNQVLDVCSIKSVKPQTKKFNFESGSLETLKNLVGTYGGYTLLPAMAAEGLAKNLALINFERPIPARQVGLVHRREHYKSHLIDALGEAILSSIPEDIRKIKAKDLEVF